MKKISPIFLVLFLALVLRLIFLFPQYSGDVKNHFVWGNAFLANPSTVYTSHFAGFNDVNYPPLAIFLFGISNLFLTGVRSIFLVLNNSFSFFPSFLIPVFSHENMQYGFLKLPGILADLGIGYLLFSFSSLVIPGLTRNPSRFRYLLPSLYLFNPAVIYLSSVWGQIEPVTNLFLLLSLYTALQAKTDKSKILSLLYFCSAALTKQTALWFAPFYLFIWYKELNIKSLAIGVVASLSLFFASYLPFGILPFAALKNYLSTLAGSSSGVSDAAWNFWYLIYPGGAEDSVRLGFLSVRTISIILLISLLFYFFYKLFKQYSVENFLKYLFIWSLAVFFLQTRVHERHLAPALVFGLLTVSETPMWWLSYLGLSLFHFLNLFLTLKIPFI